MCYEHPQDDKYLLYPALSPAKPIAVFYHPDAATDDMLRSMLHAARLRYILSSPSSEPTLQLSAASLRTSLADSRAWTERNFDTFKRSLEEKGWKTDEIAFADRGNRLLWGSEAERDA